MDILKAMSVWLLSLVLVVLSTLPEGIAVVVYAFGALSVVFIDNFGEISA